jgi:hypothetical protein
VWGGQRVFTKGHDIVFRRGVAVSVHIGEPIVPEPGEKVQVLLRRTRAAMEDLLAEAQRSYPDQPSGDDDRWWLPAHLGGTAPTPEEAALRDVQTASGHHVRRVKPHPVKRLVALVTRRRGH